MVIEKEKENIAEKVYKEFKKDEGVYFDFEIRQAIWRAMELQMAADFETMWTDLDRIHQEMKKEQEKEIEKEKEIVKK